MLIIFAENTTNTLIDLSTGSIASDEKILIDEETFDVWKTDTDILNLVLTKDITLYNGELELEPIDGLKILFGNKIDMDASMSMDLTEFKDENGNFKTSQQAQPHNNTHLKGEPDELNVQDLSGVLANPQHVIPEECISAMGDKSNTNPLNHDRFQQSEVEGLPESQLDLNYRTHDNTNDPTDREKSALGSSFEPSTTNPFITRGHGDSLYSSVSHPHNNLITDDQKASIDASNSPSLSNPVATLADIEEPNKVSNYSSLPDGVGEGIYYRSMADEAEHEAGWYRSNGDNTWTFYPSTESHSHTWLDLNKSGSKISDIADVPTYPVEDGDFSLIKSENGLEWKEQEETGTSSKKIVSFLLNRGFDSSVNTSEFFYHNGWLSGSWSGFTKGKQNPLNIPFKCKIKAASIHMRGFYNDWRDTAGDVYASIDLCKEFAYEIESVVKIGFTIPGNYEGYSNAYENISIYTEDITVIEGTNEFQAGDLIAALSEKWENGEGSIYKYRNLMINLILEEI